MIEADNKASAAAKKMKTADFISRIASAILTGNGIASAIVAGYSLWNRLIGRNCKLSEHVCRRPCKRGVGKFLFKKERYNHTFKRYGS